MRISKALTFVISAAALACSTAQASTYSDLLSQYNEIVFGNVSSGSETEGRAVIGGNLTQSGSGNYCYQTSDGSGPCGTSPLPATTASITVAGNAQSLGGLTVYGNVSGSGVSAGKGSIVVGGTNNGAVTLSSNTQTAYIYNQATASAVGGNGNLFYTTHPNGITPASQNGTVTQGTFTLPSFATTFQNPLQYLSTYLSGLTGNNQGTSNQFNATPTTINGVSVTVYNVLGSNLPVVIQNANFQLNGAQTVIINVTGPVGTLSSNLNAFTGSDNVIWNFVNQTSLTLPGWSGIVLAPTTAVTLNGISQGDIVAASLTQGANEIHDYAFTGNLNFVPATPPAVPEPGGLALIGLGAAILLAVRGRLHSGPSGSGKRICKRTMSSSVQAQPAAFSPIV